MCGIDTAVGSISLASLNPARSILRRGPDGQNSVHYELGNGLNAWFSSTTLYLRGDQCIIQPLEDQNFILQWNGEIYDGFENYLRLCSICPDDSNEDFVEVPTNGIYYVDLMQRPYHPQFFPWSVDGPLTKPILKITTEQNIVVSDQIVDVQTIEKLRLSIGRRVLTIPQLDDITSSKVAILFSGGIDSVILAIIADLVVPTQCPIDLINVAFYNNRFVKYSSMDDYDVPDRISGLEALKDLQQISSQRPWNFIKVNVSHSEYFSYKDYVAKLMKPSETVMDFSIAIALWFAARGVGIIHGDTNSNYQSKAKVILVGMGADEQLGGYSRHRAAFERAGHIAVVEEIQKELDRISSRNLGRDDRCISDHGKEARFPFLDEDYVNFLAQLPITQKCDLSLPRGRGEKALFRRIAKQFGFSNKVVYLPKRAIQFGAKTAKLENNNSSGHDRISLN